MRIAAATLAAREPGRLERWYADTLGARVAFRPGPPGPHHLALHVESLDTWRKRLDLPLIAAADGTVEFDFADWGGARSIYLPDPEGNVLELVARPDPPPESTLAEVGLPVPDVDAALEHELGLPHYDGNRETFAAVGDEDGLLIVVREGRAWFPTDEPARASPIEVVLETGRDGTLQLPGSGHVVRTAAAAAAPERRKT